jgi:haloacetate dehalogenase
MMRFYLSFRAPSAPDRMAHSAAWFDGFTEHRVALPGVGLRVRLGPVTPANAAAPPLLLVHGFPQTSAMWHRVARELAPRFRLVLPDLRGYGESDKPDGGADHAGYAKRTMAADLHALMVHLGHAQYLVAGHDRGARVAHRLALDQPQAVLRLAVIDIVPTLDMYEQADQAFGRAYYHWFFLIQPAPHPERLIGADPEAYARWKLGGWGSGGRDFYEPEALAEYLRCYARPETIHATCEDYRAGAGIDLDHDRASRAAGQRIPCPLLVLWGQRGVIQALYRPLELWQAQCVHPVQGQALDAGHFLAEERPAETAAALGAFFGG